MSKTFHRIHVAHKVQPHELDGRYHAAHEAHDHAPMQPHEVDGHDHIVEKGPAGVHLGNQKVNTYTGNHPYHLGNVHHPEAEKQYGNAGKLGLPNEGADQSSAGNPNTVGNLDE